MSKTDIKIVSLYHNSRFAKFYVIGLLYLFIAMLGIMLIARYIHNVQFSLNGDTYINSILHPYLSVADHSLLNKDFLYSNGDHRLVGISAFHIIPAMIFPDDPWAVYFWGTLFRSAVFICLMTYICKALNAGLFLTFAIVMFISLPTGYQYLEHVHAQGSYVFTHMLIPISITAIALHFKTFEIASTSKEILESVKPNQTSKRILIIIAMVVILALLLNAPRGLVTLAAPLLSAYVVTILLTRTPIKKNVFKMVALIIGAVLIGMVGYVLVKSHLAYTYGASKPFLLDQWPGQIRVLKDMLGAWEHLVQWGVGQSTLNKFRNVLGPLLLIYLAIRFSSALWHRTDRLAVFVSLFTMAVIASLAIAFNFTDIEVTPRYILPILVMVLMSLIVLPRNKSMYEKIVVSVCVAVFPLAAFELLPRDDRVAENKAKQNEVMFSYLRDNEVSHGVATWKMLGLLNINFGPVNFSPAAFGPDDTLTATPFGTSFYLRNFQPQPRTALVFMKNHRRDSVDLKNFEGVLSRNGMRLYDNVDFKLGRSEITVAIIEGDVRTLQSKVGSGNDKIYIPVNPKANVSGNASLEKSKKCAVALNVKSEKGAFAYSQSAMLLHEGEYKYKIDFDGPQPGKAGNLSVFLVDYVAKKSTSIPYEFDYLPINIQNTGIYGFRISSSKPLIDYKICGTQFYE